jgi:oligoendopeptidase F
LEKTFEEAKYLLSEGEERIMTLKSGASHNRWTEMVAGFIAKEERSVLGKNHKKVTRNFSEILNLLDDTDVKIRDSAAEAVNDIFAKQVPIAEHEVNAICLNKKMDDIIRSVPRPDTIRHVSDDIDTTVVDVLVATVERRYLIAQKFYALKARMLGVKQMKYHERNVPIVVKNKGEKKYTFSQAAALVHSVFGSLDTEFADIFEGFVTKGLVDVYPAKGKRNGAFCAHYTKALPTYILLNFDDSLNDVLTLAHEAGHGINNEMMRKKQIGINFATPTSTAEVASTFMEDFVVERILKEADENLRLSLMMKRLQDDVATIFRQVAFYRFEQDLHKAFREKGYLSHQEIGGLFQQHMKAYMGPAVAQSPGSENWWVYVNHFRYFFYVYSYASGLLISKSLQRSVRQDATFIGKVKEFLAAGTSESPQNIFLKMGVDICDNQFWERGLDEVESLLTQTEKLAKQLNVISASI